MITGFRMSNEMTIFFLGIIMVLSTISDSKTFEENSKCDALPKRPDFKNLSNILSRDIFAQTDPLNYIMAKVKKTSHIYYAHTKYVVDGALAKKELPSCYIPYGNLLSSFLRCWMYFFNADSAIREIKFRSANGDDFSSLLRDISSTAELSELFSSDIFSDPESPTRLFYKFFDMSTDEIASLKIQLQNLLHKWRGIPFNMWHYFYVDTLFKVLREESVLGDLKRDIVQIQRELTSDTDTIVV